MTRVNTSISFSAKKIPYTNQDLPKTTIKLDVLIKYLRKGEVLRSLFFTINFRIDIINKEPVKLYIYCIQTMNMSIYKQLSTFFYPLHQITISYPPYLKKNPAISTPGFQIRRDRGTPANLTRSNEATSRVTKAQSTNSAYADLADEVILLLF